MTDLPEAAQAPAPGARMPWVVSEHRGGLWAAVALLLTGVFFAWQSTPLDFGKIGLPGPGFFPFVLGIVLVAFAVVIIVEAVRSEHSEGTVAFGHRDVLIAFAAMLAVPVLFEPLGSYLTLGLFSVALLVFVGRVNPIRAAAASAVGMVAVWYFFKVLLGLQLPNGPF